MCHTMYRPGPPLDQFVDCFWHWDGYPAPAAKERALPSGSLDLIINLDVDRLTFFALDEATALRAPGMVLCGAHARYVTIGTGAGMTVMGVHFKPGGAAPFLRVSAAELEDTFVSLDALWGTRAPRLHAQLSETQSTQERFRRLEAALRSELQPLDIHPAVAEALHAFEDPQLRSVADVNARTGLSPRLLIQHFRSRIGLTPKAYWRIRRFQAALRHLENSRGASGAEVAADHGYFDQAHLIRDFQAFAGMSPRAYLAQEVFRPNHVPLRGKNIQYRTPATP